MPGDRIGNKACTLGVDVAVAKAALTMREEALRSGLKFDVERSGADTAAIHRAENLNIANGVESESSRDAGFHQFDDPLHRDLRLFD